MIYDYIRDIAYEMGVSGNETPAWIIDNLVVNWDFVREWEDAYERALENENYLKKGEWILLI